MFCLTGEEEDKNKRQRKRRMEKKMKGVKEPIFYTLLINGLNLVRLFNEKREVRKQDKGTIIAFVEAKRVGEKRRRTTYQPTQKTSKY